MPTPFPGMDPYLEQSGLWPDVHNRLIVGIAEVLAEVLRPDYYVSIEERAYLLDLPDASLIGVADLAVIKPRVRELAETYTALLLNKPIMVSVLPFEETRESYLEVRSVGDHNSITVIEILSPANKRSGAGRRVYLEKRQQILQARTNLIEIDLRRTGYPMPAEGNIPASDYRILVSRVAERPQAALYLFTIRQSIPSIPVPLLPQHPEPELNLLQLLHSLYERAAYDLRIDYRVEAEPSLQGSDIRWADQLLIHAGKRSALN